MKMLRHLCAALFLVIPFVGAVTSIANELEVLDHGMNSLFGQRATLYEPALTSVQTPMELMPSSPYHAAASVALERTRLTRPLYVCTSNARGNRTWRATCLYYIHTNVACLP